ncbi:MAG TPA: hypothetical protein VK528_10510 [Flavobacterium sp.]|nr:hypothetical protein [Flavobacterium sp.]
MLLLYFSEEFREIPIEDPLRKRYAVSNYGRLVSFNLSIKEDGKEIKGGRSDGYKTLHYRYTDKKGKKRNKYIFLYKLIAEYFIPKDSEDQAHVLHLDYVRDNDKVNNLKWATREEMLAHSRKSPHVIASRVRKTVRDGRKLTTTQVIRLKKQLLDPQRKTRMKILAKQFNVSEMQLYRIKSGENWGHIVV